ncbi:hypothetical protein L486_00612 [Kwoniella mangroviensis CBS 10435]|uniref:Selenoprotein O n=1 Tax=Kwoniella mangroviensis CBS 10435 TaxID=1331196 RepID=A0A1B9IZL2_9TREE|nr:hypothetical protein L486_00612 [Kwoniella mangroviensis CBS 10435]OCF74283.1 hypothetical protein I204_04654 [Kwoniella mangroviensis CBS 8886]
MSSQKLPIHRLPVPSSTLQHTLPQLTLEPKPSSQRRATTFDTTGEGVWARVNPLWAAWPLRITKEEALGMGVDVEKGEQIDVEDVLRRWDPIKLDHTGIPHDTEDETNGLNTYSSDHRLKLAPILLGISASTLKDSLPHLTVGDAPTICNRGASPSPDATPAALVRNAFIDVLSGRKVPRSKKEAEGEGREYGPWSTRYCGHQFGSWAGQLGDGRAISILETESEEGGRQELQLKGAGRTPFSRSADGLAVLRSGVREFLGCEAIAALQIPTTRSLALLTTPFPDVPVVREHGPEPSSLLCRVSPSFIRIGHFQALNPSKADQGMRQFFLGGRGWLDDQNDLNPDKEEGNLEGLRKLTEWVKNDIMQMQGSITKEWLEEVVQRNAETVAKWQVYGWMHGVLNTDNISLTGATIDYGPYAFMDVYDERHICNHSDPSGLYNYRNQPSRVLFALDKLVSTLAPILGYEAFHSSTPIQGYSEGLSKETKKEWEEKGLEVFKGFEERFWEIEREEEKRGWARRFGLKTSRESDSRDIFLDYLSLLSTHKIDFHTSFRKLSFFRPTLANDAEYLSKFVTELIEESTTNVSDDKLNLAEKDFEGWIKIYAERASNQEEKEAYGNSAGEGWEGIRSKEMKASNPRFVLRQWVLEETIEKMEKALTKPYVEAKEGQAPEEWEIDLGVREARQVLAKILDMSTRPFEPYGEGEGKGSDFEEDKRLCGLGKKEMLGFQCSCSS